MTGEDRMRSPAALVTAVFILLGFVALGLALAFDFRGVAREYAERCLASNRRFGGQAGLRRTPEGARRLVVFVTVIQRAVGLIFALASSAVLIAVIVTA